MKKIKFSGKLSLNKETISKLNNEQMNQVNGGTGSGCTGSRYCSQGCPPITIGCPETVICPLPTIVNCQTTPEFAC